MDPRSNGRRADGTRPDRRHTWHRMDPSGLIERLTQAQALLQQAAVVAAATDGARLSAMAELQRRLGEERHDDAHRRRYR
ncbi:hypothetical protein SAMN05444365_10630 [Micromonospora pattaloongensis]|uniref:Uncharacterized protein n=1 Tax=Micromonospora pattaloongensis TaxID=405436 RepID=A0A1H3QMZ0_9ACTN|nr:hypothetical protein [Micromonospora pattaloongensis]SDZ14954.1 hypothetical protein SAMN05444365_10630 [Micromonospora pattaloongensis]